MLLSFFFQAEDGIRDGHVTGVQTCALPISSANTTKTRTAPAIDADSGRPITRWKVESVRTRSSAAGCGGGAPGGGATIFGAVAPPFVSPVGCASAAPDFTFSGGRGFG